MERLEGFGQLRRETDGTDSAVRFSFLCTDVRLPTDRGLALYDGNSDATGSVVAADGHSFAEGTYRLFAADGQQMRVQKLGTDWYLLWPARA